MNAHTRPDRWDIHDIEAVFADFNRLSEGEWSQHGIFIPYGDENRREYIEVGLQKDFKDYVKQVSWDCEIPETSDCYTLQMFAGDEVVGCFPMYAVGNNQLRSVDGDNDQMIQDYRERWEQLKSHIHALENALNNFTRSMRENQPSVVTEATRFY